MSTTTLTVDMSKQINYHVVPFALPFDTNYSDVVKKLDDSSDWQKAEVAREELLEHIADLIVGEAENDDDTHTDAALNHIGCVYKLQTSQDVRLKHDLPISINKSIDVLINGIGQFVIKVPEVRLYLFETNVGFVVFDVAYKDNGKNQTDAKYYYPSLDYIIEGNYYFKKVDKNRASKNAESCLASDGNKPHICMIHDYKTNINKDKPEEDPIMEKKVRTFNQDQVIAKIFSKLKIKVDTYFNQRDYATNALVYSFSIIERGEYDKQQIGKALYRLRRTFKSSYLPSQKDSALDHVEVLQNFENSYWGVSLEGLAHIVLKTGHKVTDTFFDSTYIGKIKGTYFTIYLLELHKRFALLNYLKQAAKLPRDMAAYIEDDNASNDKSAFLNELIERTTFLRLRCLFDEVASYTHINNYSDFIQKNLNVNKLMNELEDEVAALKSTADLRDQLSKQVFNKFIARISQIFAFIGVFALANDLTDTFEKVLSPVRMLVGNPLNIEKVTVVNFIYLVIPLILLLLLITLGVQSIRIIRGLYRKK